MPWRRPYYYRPWTRRRRWFWTRRSRPFIRRRRRRWRKRVRRYFPKKLKTITLKEWQPHSIKKCKITGMICLLQANVNRLGNNFTLYENSIVPPHLPGGGGFSIMKFSLKTLFEQHQYDRNWWTQSNKEMPLCRYLGCKFKIYQSDTADYTFRYINSPPFTATNYMYASTQPSMQMMMNNTILIPSTKTKQRKRPYKTIRIKPPTMLTNKWYFQHDLLNQGLVLTMASAASFQEYYIKNTWQSINITIISLNTKLFTNRNFHTHDTSGYYSRELNGQKTYLYATDQPHPNITTLKIGQIIFLGQTRYYTHGETYNTRTDKTKNWSNWKQHPPENSWGNPFMAEYISGDMPLLYSTKPPSEIFNKNSENDTVSDLTFLTSTITWDLRYNPNRDDGSTTQIYLLPNYEHAQQHGWEPLNKPELMFEGFPLWLGLWGYIDFQKKQATVSQIDTHHILVIKNKTTAPQADYIVPLGYKFTHDKSPYEDEVNSFDKDKWYPMVQYQEESINQILSCGPGTMKLPDYVKTSELHMKYTFYFKFGGNPPPMNTVIDPQNQPVFPMPNNEQQTTSLQNPATAPQYFLYNFDTRRNIITQRAAERITRDYQTKDYSFPDTGFSMDTSPIKQTQQTSSDETSSEKEEEETLFHQLQQQRRKQKRIKQRILRLLTQIQSTE
nr:MAG: ORF1 [TTV-like mini virus]